MPEDSRPDSGAAGWDVVAGIDVDHAVGPTYRRNNPATRFIHADLRNIRDDDVRSLASGLPSRELLLAGCAPCQAFSKQRGRRGIRDRSDATLLREFARLVLALRPRAVLMENVPGITAVPGFSSFRRFIKTLHDCGYDYNHRVLNARDFGVPQHRRRRVLLAVLDTPATPPDPLIAAAGARLVTVRSAIAHFPAIDAGEAHPNIANHQAARLSPLNLQRIRATPADGGSRRDWDPDLVLDCHRSEATGFSDVYGRMWWNRVAPTLTSRCNSLSNGTVWASTAGPGYQSPRSRRAPNLPGRLRVLRLHQGHRAMDRECRPRDVCRGARRRHHEGHRVRPPHVRPDRQHPPTEPPPSPERSANMARIGSTNTLPELAVRQLLHRLGYRFRLHWRSLPGTPDICFPGRKKVVFVHGCFWHRHEGCRRTTTPITRTSFWRDKFHKNVERDRANLKALRELGWSVMIIWECDTVELEALSSRLVAFLNGTA